MATVREGAGKAHLHSGLLLSRAPPPLPHPPAARARWRWHGWSSAFVRDAAALDLPCPARSQAPLRFLLTARAQQKRAAGTVAQRRRRLPPPPSSQAALVRRSGVTTRVRPLGPRDTLEKAKCFHSSLYLYVFYKDHPTCSPVTLPTHPPFLCGQGCLSEGGAGPGPARRLDPLPSAPLCGQRGSLGQRLRPSLNPRLWPLA